MPFRYYLVRAWDFALAGAAALHELDDGAIIEWKSDDPARQRRLLHPHDCILEETRMGNVLGVC